MRGRAGVVTAQLSRLPWCKNKKKVAIIASGIRVARSLTYHSPVDEAHLNFCKNLWLRDQSSTKRISQRHRVDSNLFRKYTFVSHASPLGLCSAHPSGRWEVDSTGCNASTSDQSAIDLSTPDSELREVLTVTQQPHDKESENLGHPGITAVEAGQSITQAADEHTGFVVVNFYRLTNVPDPLAEVAKHQEFVKVGKSSCHSNQRSSTASPIFCVNPVAYGASGCPDCDSDGRRIKTSRVEFTSASRG